ncbi:hypothetical protein [Clostridium sardiniense]|uniref:hypothetical protein n=1 Tax=Clostridium sardiniense TaxID=29369 RepID=UPI001957BF23|nr:hypothetical protein [Clostridium sardiniense]MBM7833216.1 hypothetical protein [Clostridium sardiniense]
MNKLNLEELESINGGISGKNIWNGIKWLGAHLQDVSDFGHGFVDGIESAASK